MAALNYVKGIGTVLSFAVLALFFGVGFLMLFLPEMLTGASLGHDLLSEVLRHSTDWLLVLFRFLSFGKSTALVARGMVSPKEAPSVDNLEIRRFPLTGHIILFISFALACVILWILFRWLLSKPPASLEEKDPLAIFRHFLRKWAERIHILFRWMLLPRAKNRYSGPDLFFRRLAHWGARSGLPRAYSGTPKYGTRLVRFFPHLHAEIEGIVEQFNRFKYGHMALNDVQSSYMRTSWKKLRAPKLWPLRLKVILRQEAQKTWDIPCHRRN